MELKKIRQFLTYILKAHELTKSLVVKKILWEVVS